MSHGLHRPDNVGATCGLTLLELLPLDLSMYHIRLMRSHFGSSIIVDCPAHLVKDKIDHGILGEEVGEVHPMGSTLPTWQQMRQRSEALVQEAPQIAGR